MENTIDAMSTAYEDFITAAVAILQAREAGAGNNRTAASEAAMENFKNRLDIFRSSCDRAEDHVLSLECLVAWAHAAPDPPEPEPDPVSDKPPPGPADPAPTATASVADPTNEFLDLVFGSKKQS